MALFTLSVITVAVCGINTQTWPDTWALTLLLPSSILCQPGSTALSISL